MNFRHRGPDGSILCLLSTLGNTLGTLFRLDARYKMVLPSVDSSSDEMTQRIEINLFFEQSLYMMLFASNAGGL
jgi:hypothetical protein